MGAGGVGRTVYQGGGAVGLGMMGFTGQDPEEKPVKRKKRDSEIKRLKKKIKKLEAEIESLKH